KFETDKEKLRQQLRAALDTSTTFEQFSTLLLRQGITVKESRGRLSYLTPDRTKPITARKLGDDFDRAAVLARLEQNAHRVVEERAAALKKEKATNTKNEQRRQPAKTHTADDGLHTLVDREKSRAKSIWYDRWAAVYNVKQLAKTYNFIKGNGINDLDTLDEAEKNARAIVAEKRKALTEIEAVIKEKNELRKAVTDYRHTRPIVDEYRKLKGKKAEKFRQDHEPDFIIYESAKKKLQRLCPGNKLPSYTKLNAEIEALISQKNALYNEYYEAKAAHKEISTVQQNAKELHLDRQQPSKKKKREQTL
ncbi:MAG: relaxase, partial [Clostridia bacterium]|nr:relaxase [Clostridia bacterium]